jgi:predicted AlkP superfamily phosphohydrolase/phosphomutase
MKAPRCLVVGLDGASFRVISPLVRKGALPNLSRLLEEGCHARLASVIPHQTPVAWTSYATGCNPGQHGIYGWWREPGAACAGLEPVSGAQIQEARLWEVVAAAGYRVGLLNVPMSSPARPINGFHVVGIDCPFAAPEGDPLAAYPRGLLGELAQAGLPYRIVPELPATACLQEALAAWVSVERARVAAAKFLADRWTPDFLQVNLFLTDYFSHRVAAEDPVLEAAYGAADDLVGQLRELAGPDTLFLIISDHGSCPIDTFIMTHNVLQDLGLLHFQRWLADEQLPRIFAGDDEARAGVAAELQRGGKHARARLYVELEAEYPGANIGFSTIDWDATSVYSTSDYGQLWLNRTRGAGAVTSQAQEKQLLRDLCRALSELQGTDGTTLIDCVLGKTALYSGRHIAAAPDLTPIPASSSSYFCQVYQFYLTGEKRAVVPIPEVVDPAAMGCRGDHDAHGILIAAGPSVPAGHQVSDASILDLAPTVLGQYGLPPLPEHDGVVLDDLFGRQRRAAQPATRREEPAASGLLARLASLGYRL